MENNYRQKTINTRYLLQKLLEATKITGIILFFCLWPSVALFANPLQDIKISISQKDIPLNKVLDEIEEKTGYTFLIRNNDIDIQEKVSVQATDKSIEGILEILFYGKNIKYEITNKNISIYKPQALPLRDQNIKQGSRINGIVTDLKGEPIIGANIMVKGTTIGTITKLDGTFTLNIPEKGILLISYIGYVSREIVTGNQSVFYVKMEESSKVLDEVIVIGYSIQKKTSLTGAISNLKIDNNLRNISSSNMTNLLAGAMAGVNITSTTGVPGTSSDIMIRTNNSFVTDDAGKPATQPIFVIDGVIRSKGDFDRLDPNEVDNVTILKDAASAAIYGARSSGGAVLVTTRKGKVGKPMFTYSGSVAMEQRGQGADLTSGVEGAELVNYIHRNDKDFWYYWDDDELEYIHTINNGYGYDHIKENWCTPISTHHAINISGGTERLRYFVNGSYYNQDGFLDKVDYSRYNFRGNIEIDVTSDLTAFIQFGSVYGTRNQIGFEGNGDLSGLYGKLQYWQWDHKTHTSDGKPIDYGWLGNIGEFTNGNSGYNKDEFQSTELQFKAQYYVPFIPGLKISGMYNHKYANNYNKSFSKKQLLYKVKKEGRHEHIWTDEVIGTTYSNWPDKPGISQLSDRVIDYQLNLQIDYARTFGKHSLNGLIVYEQAEGSGRYFNGGRETYPILVKDQWFATSNDRKDSWVNGNEWESGRLSYIGQLNYTYSNKYLLNASLRVDGSMNYAPSKRYGYFPAISGAWIISEEKFFNSSNVNFLKLRTSVGLTGNDTAIGWRWQERYAYSNNKSYFGTSPVTFQGIQFGGIVNPNATWDKSLSYNVGTDIDLFNHWSVSVDYWFQNTYDILANRIISLPTSFGFSMPKENYGEVHSSGIDLEVTYTNKANKVNFFVKGVFSYGTNKVIVQDYAQNAMYKDIPAGKKIGYMNGYRDLGIVRTQSELNEINAYYKELYGANHEFTIHGHKLALGMLTYQDLSGPNGKPDGKIDGYDEDVLSMHSVPPFTAGLTLGVEWKGISVQTLFQGSFGHKRFADSKFRNLLEWNRAPRIWLDHWSDENPDASMPQPLSYNDGAKANYNQNSTFWMYDADFIKMKYLNIGYFLPQSWVNKIGAGYVKLFFSTTNLFSISKFDLWDPEVGSSSSYPNMKTFNFGLDFSF